jgi:hypothetical protein
MHARVTDSAPRPTAGSLPYPLDLALRQRVVDHTVGAIAATRVENEPFPHVAVHSFLPPDVYAEIVSHRIAAEHYEAFAHGYKNRGRVRFDGDSLRRLPPAERTLWFSVRSALGSAELRRAVFGKFADALALRFGCDPAAARALDGYALPELYRETEGYSIKPHPDTRKKIVTMQISLAGDEAQAELGTEFYRLSLNPVRWSREFKGFEMVRRMPFLPNSGYAFVVFNTLQVRSWHGRSELPTGCGVRDSLLNIWYAKPEHGNAELVEELAVFGPQPRL